MERPKFVQTTNPAMIRLVSLANQRDLLAKERNRIGRLVSSRKSATYASVIFAENPDPYLELTEMSRRFSLGFGQVAHLQDESGFLDWCSQEDIFRLKDRGVSLWDIENMPLPFSNDDFQRVSNFFRMSDKNFFRKQVLLAKEAALLLPAQALARSQFLNTHHNRPFPRELERLRARMASYFDYYEDIFTNPDTHIESLTSFIFHLASRVPFFHPPLISYIAAKYGISPSSTVKLFENFFKLSCQDSFGLGQIYLRYITKESKDSFRSDTLSKELDRYRHYDPQNEQRVKEQLQDHYSLLNNMPRGFFLTRLNEVLARLNHYRKGKGLIADIKSAGEVRVDMPDHALVREVIVTAQYSQTLMFILLLRDQKTHLLLEANGITDRLFGIPFSLTNETPHIVDLFGVDILGNVLTNLKERYPNTESRPKIAVNSKPLGLLPVTRQPKFDFPEELLGTEKTPDKKKSKSGIKMARNLFTGISKLGSEVPRKETRGRKYKVHHSRRQIREMLGKRTPEQVVDDVMGAISSFEKGERRIIRLTDDTIDRIRAGDYRVGIQHIGNGNFVVEWAKNRKEAYN